MSPDPPLVVAHKILRAPWDLLHREPPSESQVKDLLEICNTASQWNWLAVRACGWMIVNGLESDLLFKPLNPELHSRVLQNLHDYLAHSSPLVRKEAEIAIRRLTDRKTHVASFNLVKNIWNVYIKKKWEKSLPPPYFKNTNIPGNVCDMRIPVSITPDSCTIRDVALIAQQQVISYDQDDDILMLLIKIARTNTDADVRSFAYWVIFRSLNTNILHSNKSITWSKFITKVMDRNMLSPDLGTCVSAINGTVFLSNINFENRRTKIERLGFNTKVVISYAATKALCRPE